MTPRLWLPQRRCSCGLHTLPRQRSAMQKERPGLHWYIAARPAACLLQHAGRAQRAPRGGEATGAEGQRRVQSRLSAASAAGSTVSEGQGSQPRGGARPGRSRCGCCGMGLQSAKRVARRARGGARACDLARREGGYRCALAMDRQPAEGGVRRAGPDRAHAATAATDRVRGEGAEEARARCASTHGRAAGGRQTCAVRCTTGGGGGAWLQAQRKREGVATTSCLPHHSSRAGAAAAAKPRASARGAWGQGCGPAGPARRPTQGRRRGAAPRGHRRLSAPEGRQERGPGRLGRGYTRQMV